MPLFDITTPSSPRSSSGHPPTMVCYETKPPEQEQQQQQQQQQDQHQKKMTTRSPAPLFAINVPSTYTNAQGSSSASAPLSPAPVAPLFSIPKQEQSNNSSSTTIATIPPSSSSSSSSQQKQQQQPLFAIPTTTNPPEQSTAKQSQKELGPAPAAIKTATTSPLFALAPSPTTTAAAACTSNQTGIDSPHNQKHQQQHQQPRTQTRAGGGLDIEQGGGGGGANNKNDISSTTYNFTTTPNNNVSSSNGYAHNTTSACSKEPTQTDSDNNNDNNPVLVLDLSNANGNNNNNNNNSSNSMMGSFKNLLKKAPSSIKSSSNKSIQFCLDDDDDHMEKRSSGASIKSKLNNFAPGSDAGVGVDDNDNSSSSGDSMGSSSHGSIIDKLKSRTGLMVVLIVFLGLGASAAFLAIGITGAQREQRDQFERTSMDLVTAIESQFERYVTAANYVHHYCRNRSFTRQDFTSLYEYLIHDGLDFKAVQFDPNVTREERPKYEEEARQYYAANYPHIKYRGFLGFDDGVENGLVPTSERDFYFPIHYMEPIIGNEAAIDLDYYSHISRRRTLSHCFEYGEPAITDRLLLVKDPKAKSRCGSQDAASYGVVLMHPGVNISDPSEGEGGIWPRDLSSIVLCIPALLKTATHDLRVASKVYIHDAAASSGQILFLGGVEMDNNAKLSYLDETEIQDIRGDMTYQQDMELTNKVWTITVVATNNTYKPNLAFVILGGVLVLLASVCLGLWVHNNTRRTHKFNAMKAKVEGEKAALILENTRQAARAERELNDFIAHEVRNPVAAAMAACSFVKSAVNETEPLVDPQKREDTREDVLVIYNSLQFVNDLLRNMLDMHRASHKQLQVNFETIDLYHDILQSTAGMIYQRDSKVKVIVECEPQNLHVRSDCLRLKQVILNLSRNASKFVNEGFIKLKGYVVDGEVRLAVEDSGIGIPAEKRDLLFAKFQESLDQLSQGTGIGLYLCKNLVELMGGEIFLDKNYNSGVPGNPGTSIIINLKRPPLTEEELAKGLDGGSEKFDEPNLVGNNKKVGWSDPPQSQLDRSHQCSEEALFKDRVLPEHLTVLFVDDDAILRKLFARSVKRVAPGWTMREASNGESALQLLDEGLEFDLIFVDQYMASIEKQLLGTETILEMRARGCQSRLFGLSANDLETEFIAAGADGFVIKPFPTETDALKHELLRAYYGKRAYYSKTR